MMCGFVPGRTLFWELHAFPPDHRFVPELAKLPSSVM
jgi:hypothetical protein